MYDTKFFLKNKSSLKKVLKIIESAYSTKHGNSLITKINMENFIDVDSSKIADCCNKFFLKIGHSIANNVNRPISWG